MRRGFYTKLAITNIRKNGKTYFPYILASSATVMMFYDMLYLLMSDEVNRMHDSSTLVSVLGLGGIVTGIFAFILLLYINSFLIKRRKKEFGLFNILGMEKKAHRPHHAARDGDDRPALHRSRADRRRAVQQAGAAASAQNTVAERIVWL